MKLFRRKAQNQRMKAQGRGLKKLQKFMEKGVATGMQDLNAEMKQVLAEYQDLMKDLREILPMMDEEIATKRAAGEDVSEMEQHRAELAQALNELETAVKDCPSQPFTALPA